jgi:hypothetical protein
MSHAATVRHRAPIVGIAAGLLLRAPLAAGAQPESTASHTGLEACASIADGANRLACYDQLAGRASPSTRQPLSKASAPASSRPSAAPVPAQASGNGATSTASAAAPAAPPPMPAPPAGAFGSYSAEHPKAPPAASKLEAAVTSVSHSPSGRMTVSLEGGALWELEDADPLLAVGDVVTITRAALGSYLMQTPTRRTHRVRRLR